MASQCPAPEIEPTRPRETGVPTFGGEGAAREGGRDEVGLQVRVEEQVGQVCAVEGEDGEREEQKEEVDVVVAADAGVEPDAMVVALGDAGTAE